MRQLALSVTIAMSALAAAGHDANAQVGIGVLGGLSAPMGDYKDLTSQGWHAGAFMDFAAPSGPFALRFEGMYHGFGDKNVFVRNSTGSATLNFSNKYSTRVGTANLRFGIPVPALPIRPYLIGGVGGYNVKNNTRCTSSPGLCPSVIIEESSDWKLGLNGGGGIAFGRRVSFFVEARYHMIFEAARDVECFTDNTSCKRRSAQLLPISVGLTLRP